MPYKMIVIPSGLKTDPEKSNLTIDSKYCIAVEKLSALKNTQVKHTKLNTKKNEIALPKKVFSFFPRFSLIYLSTASPVPWSAPHNTIPRSSVPQSTKKHRDQQISISH